MASYSAAYDDDSEFEFEEEEDLFPLIPPEAVEAYRKLKNCFFKGRYTGQYFQTKAEFQFSQLENQNRKVSRLLSQIDAWIDQDEFKVRNNENVTLYQSLSRGVTALESSLRKKFVTITDFCLFASLQGLERI